MNTCDELKQTIQKYQDDIKEKMIDNIMNSNFSENKDLENQHNNLDDFLKKIIPPKEIKVNKTTRSNNQYTKSSKTILRVSINDMEIEEKKAAMTFAKTLEYIGFDKVSTLGLKCCATPLVSKNKPAQDGNYPNYKQLKDWYVITHSSTKDKKQILDEISQKLNLNMKVDIV